MSEAPRWFQVATLELGVAEVKGSKHNPRIIDYHFATSLKATEDEVPWCSAFANWCMKQAMIKGTGSASARSWLSWGYKMEKPVVGTICVFKRGTNPVQGHVGFYAGEDDHTIHVLGGNQGDKVSIGKYKKTDLLGYRWPFQVLPSA
jgi:uncharacterized protein (TIGR02594 family)